MNKPCANIRNHEASCRIRLGYWTDEGLMLWDNAAGGDSPGNQAMFMWNPCLSDMCSKGNIGRTHLRTVAVGVRSWNIAQGLNRTECSPQKVQGHFHGVTGHGFVIESLEVGVTNAKFLHFSPLTTGELSSWQYLLSTNYMPPICFSLI